MRLVIVIMILISTLYSYAGENNNIDDDSIARYIEWNKMIISDNNAFCIVPYNLFQVAVPNNNKSLPSYVVGLQKKVSNSLSSDEYTKCKIGINRFFRILVNSYLHYFGNSVNHYPYAYDFSNNKLSLVEMHQLGDPVLEYSVCIYSQLYWNSYINDPRHHLVAIEQDPLRVDYDNKKSEDQLRLKKNIEKYAVYYNIERVDDQTVNFFALKNNQLICWEIKMNDNNDVDNLFNFEFTFKLPYNKPFEICRIDNAYYILLKDHGIYKVSEHSTELYKPEPPKNVLTKYNKTVLTWSGFTQPYIVENKVKAEKVSDLKYDRYVVDKDHSTAYIISNNYLYEMRNLKKRSKIPELPKIENFIDKEAEYMRAVLNAIINLRAKPEKTPEELLKVTPDSEIDKMLAEQEAKNASNSGLDDDDDDDDSNNNANAGNGETSVDNDDDSDTDNNTGSSESTNNDESKNSDSALTDKDSDKDNTNPKNSDNASLSDGTNVLTYIGISAGSIILLSLIFLVLFRKRRI